MQSTYKQTSACVHMHTETTADYALADYQGDIKKVLLAEGKLLPSPDFLGEGEGQLSGSVLYDILYTDAEGGMCALQLTSDYDMTLSTPEGARQMLPELRISGVSVRLSGPRKISLKAAVCADVRFVCELCAETEGEGMAHEPTLRESTHPVRHTLSACAEDRSYTDIAPLDGVRAESCEVLMTGGCVTVNDVTVQEGCVQFNALVTMHALLRTEEDEMLCLSRTVTSQETVVMDGVDADAYPLVLPRMPTVAAVLQADAEGVGECQLTAHTSFDIRADVNAPLTLVSDGYVCEYESKNSYAELSCEEYVQSLCLRAPCSLSLGADAWDTEVLREVLYTTAALKSVRAFCEDGTLSVEGEVQVSAVGICFDEEGRRLYTPIRASIPFATTAPAPCDGLGSEASACVGAVEAAIDGDALLLRAEVRIGVTLTRKQTLTYLSHMDVCSDAPLVKEGATITVYYPRRDEDLWDIARAHHTTPSAIARDNGLDVEAISDGKQLALPEHLLIF